MPKENKSKTPGQKSRKFVKKMVTSEVLGPSIGDAILDTIECAGALMNFVANRTPEEDEKSEGEDSVEEPTEEIKTGDVALQNMRIILSPRTDQVLLDVLDACCSCRIVKCKKNETGDAEEENEDEDTEKKTKEEEEMEKERKRKEKEEEKRKARERKDEEKRMKEQKEQEEREKAKKKKKEEEEWEKKRKEEEEEWKRNIREKENMQNKIWEEEQRKRMEQEEKEREKRKIKEEEEWKRKRQEEEEEWKKKLREEEDRQRKIWEKEQRDRMEQEEREREKRKAEEEEAWKRKREEEEEEWKTKLEEEKERQRKIWEEEQRSRMEQEEREREKRRAEEEEEWKRKRQEEEEEMRRKIKKEEARQKELWEDEQRQRLKEEEEERKKRKREEEEEWKRKRQEEEEEWKRAIKEEKEAKRKIWEEEQRERMKREEEERAKRKKEEEEGWKRKRQEDEEEMRRKLEEEDEKQRKLWEEEQSKRLKEEEEERKRRKSREEEDWKRKRMEEEEERRRKRREKEERQNRLWEEEQRKRMEQEEREREKRKREDEDEWLRKKQEEEERQMREWEKEEKERIRRRSVEEEESKRRRAEEEEERKRKKREKEERQKRMWEEEQRKREEEEEQERARRKREEEEEWDRKRKEEEEKRKKEEEEEKRKKDEMEKDKKDVDIRRVYDEVIEEYDESNICGAGSEMVYHRHSTVVEKHVNLERQDVDQEFEKKDNTADGYTDRRSSHLQPRRISQEKRVNQYGESKQKAQESKKSKLNNSNRTVVKSSLTVEEFDPAEFDQLCGEDSFDFVNEDMGDQINDCKQFKLTMKQIVSSSECSQSDDSIQNDDECCKYKKRKSLNSRDNADRERRISNTPRISIATTDKSRNSVSRRQTLNGESNGKVDRMFSIKPNCFDTQENEVGNAFFKEDYNPNKMRMSIREGRRNSKLRESKSSERWADSNANEQYASAPRTSRSEKTGYGGSPDDGQFLKCQDRRSTSRDISPMPTIVKTTVKEFDPDGITVLRKTITEVKQSPRATENETVLRGTFEENNNKDHTVFKKTVTNIERNSRTSEERPTYCDNNDQDFDCKGQSVLRKTTTELEKGVITNEGKPKVIKRQLEESAPCDDITVARFVAEAEKCHKCVLSKPAMKKKSCKEIDTCNSTIFEKTVTEVERRPRSPKRALNANNGQVQDENSCTDILYEKVLEYSPGCPQGRPVIVTRSKYKEVGGTNSTVFEASINDYENCSECPEKQSTVIKMTTREISPESTKGCGKMVTCGERNSNRPKERSKVKDRRSSETRRTHEHSHCEKLSSRAKGAVSGKRLSKGCGKSEIDMTTTVDSGKMGFETVMLKNGKKVRFGKGNISFDPNKPTSLEIEAGAEMNGCENDTPLWKQHTEKKKRENRNVGRNCDAENVLSNLSTSSIKFHYHTRDGRISGTSEIDIQQRFCHNKGEERVIPTKLCPQRLCADPCGGDNENPCAPGRLSTLLQAQACIAPKRQRNPKAKKCRKKPNVLWAIARINEFGEQERTLEILSTDDKKPPILKKCHGKNEKYNHEIFAVVNGT